MAVGLLLEWAPACSINSTHLNPARVWSRGLNISGRCHTFQLCVHVVVAADGNSSVSASSSYKAVSTSLIDSRQSLPLVVVYVTLTAAALSVVASLLLQLDVIVSRRPPSAAAAVSCRSVATLVAWCWRRAGSLSMFTPLVIYIGIIDAFVACEFTAVCLTLCVVFKFFSKSLEFLMNTTQKMPRTRAGLHRCRWLRRRLGRGAPHASPR